MYSKRFLPLAAVGVILGACGDQRQQPSRPAGTVPISKAESAGDAADFTGRVPRLDEGAQPSDTLALNRLFGDSLAFASISGIQPLGRQLLVTDRMMSKHLALIDLRSGAVQGRAGGDGAGPNEFRDPGAFIVESVSPPRSWVYDFQNRRLALLSASGDGELRIEKSRPFNVGVSIEQPLRIGDRFIANGLFPDYTLVVLDSTAKPVQRIEADPPFPARVMPHVIGRRQLNRSYYSAR